MILMAMLAGVLAVSGCATMGRSHGPSQCQEFKGGGHELIYEVPVFEYE